MARREQHHNHDGGKSPASPLHRGGTVRLEKIPDRLKGSVMPTPA